MQVALPATTLVAEHHENRKPGVVELATGLFLLSALVLHIIGMVPTYLAGRGSLISQADQGSAAGIITAMWAAALIIGLWGPRRVSMCAAVAVGTAVTELGLRETDLGIVWSGSDKGGAGLWITAAGWAVGAVGAGLAVLAAYRRRAPRPSIERSASTDRSAEGTVGENPPQWVLDWAPPGADHRDDDVDHSDVSGPPPREANPDMDNELTPDGQTDDNPYADPTTEVAAVSLTDATVAMAVPDEPHATGEAETSAVRSGDTAVFQAIPDEDPGSRVAWTVGIGILALITAGAFLPAWDHSVITSTVSGASASYNSGNAFAQPWQMIVGSVIVAVAIAFVPIAAVRIRDRRVGASLAVAAILVLASQFVSAVVNLDLPIPASQRSQDTVITMKLTGWFTLDVLAAFALLVAVVVWATMRVAHENSSATFPRAPDSRSAAMPWGS